MAATGVFAREFPEIGPVQVGAAGGKVISVSFPESLPADADPDHPALDALAAALDGEATPTEVEIGLTVPTDRRRVLEATRQIPPGERASLAQVAHMANLDPEDADDAETVGAALRENPVPPFVPDHRVDLPGATPERLAERLRAAEG